MSHDVAILQYRSIKSKTCKVRGLIDGRVLKILQKPFKKLACSEKVVPDLVWGGRRWDSRFWFPSFSLLRVSRKDVNSMSWLRPRSRAARRKRRGRRKRRTWTSWRRKWIWWEPRIDFFFQLSASVSFYFSHLSLQALARFLSDTSTKNIKMIKYFIFPCFSIFPRCLLSSFFFCGSLPPSLMSFLGS